MKIIINSEMRVGSRWLHYLLGNLYSMRIAPEVDVSNLEDRKNTIRNYLNNNIIVKTHHATTGEIFSVIRPVDYTIISVVRNPRDRIISKAFHHRYTGDDIFDSDVEAVEHYVYNDYTQEANRRQLEQMSSGYSTRKHSASHHSYIWTTYEWMLDDIYKEAALIDQYLGVGTKLEKIRQICDALSFQSITGREQGEEERDNGWIRKGIIGDWINWFDVDMLNYTSKAQQQYWKQLLMNKGTENNAKG